MPLPNIVEATDPSEDVWAQVGQSLSSGYDLASQPEVIFKAPDSTKTASGHREHPLVQHWLKLFPATGYRSISDREWSILNIIRSMGDFNSDYGYPVPTWIESYFAGTFRPRPADEDPRKISLYKSAKDTRRTVMKAGRAIKHMFPTLSDKEVGRISDYWVETHPYYKVDDFEVNVGDTAFDFTTAYEADIFPEASTFEGKYHSKSLHNSCMQHTYWHKHPAAVYASGDFAIITVWHKETSQLAARVVYYKGNMTAAPIYQSNLMATELIHTKMKELGVKLWDGDATWFGARLLAIQTCPCENGNNEEDDGHCCDELYLAPYLDHSRQMRLDADGKYWNLTNNNYNTYAGTTSGYVYEGNI